MDKDLKKFEPDSEVLRDYANRNGYSVHFAQGAAIYRQGDPADSTYYVVKGRVRQSVVSPEGKEAVIGIAEPQSFIGEAAVVGQSVRLSSAIAMTDCDLLRFERSRLVELLDSDPKLAGVFISHLVSRTVRLEEDIVDHLFNSSEKRLARILLLLAHYGEDQSPKPIRPKLSHETLAEMVGTTRPRITQFMNKFRKLGFISYNETIEVHPALLTVLLQNS